jgi:hypothetical protein
MCIEQPLRVGREGEGEGEEGRKRRNEVKEGRKKGRKVDTEEHK